VSKRDLKGIRHEVWKFICILQERVERRTFVDAIMKVSVHEQVIDL
jgi:hypothetical protein